MTKNDTAEQTKISSLRHIKVELHVIQNFPPSCLNRDDTGMPKECLFGGVRRARVSSQCLKYWMRKYFEETGREIGVRTKELRHELLEMLVKQDTPEAERAQFGKAVSVFLSLYYSAMETQKTRNTKVPLFVGRLEMREAANCIIELRDVLIDEADKREADKLEVKAAKADKRKAKERTKKEKLGADEKIEKRIKQAQHTIDIALFGRMMAAKPGQNVDGSCQVAHAISTHRVYPELDYYTTVDDVVQRRLQQARDFFIAANDLELEESNEEAGEDVDDAAADDVDDENSIPATADENDDNEPEDETDTEPDASAGAAMLGLIGYNSACYYRYLLLDSDELEKNLHSPSEADLEADIRLFFEAALATLPQAKQTSMGQQVQPSFYMFVVRHKSAPASLANAFAEPVRLDGAFEDINSDQDVVGKSIARLDNYWSVLTRVYGREGITGLPIVEPYFHADRLTSLKNSVVQMEDKDQRGSSDIALDRMVELVRQARRERQEENAGGTA